MSLLILPAFIAGIYIGWRAKRLSLLPPAKALEDRAEVFCDPYL